MYIQYTFKEKDLIPIMNDLLSYIKDKKVVLLVSMQWFMDGAEVTHNSY